jgi:AGZA family xanthine/uracil permease-like MFS transporter
MEGINNFFKIKERGSTILTEMRAGVATFMTMCYILAVNARLLADSGGPCECSAATADDFACVFYDTEYAVCLENFRRQLVTVTALASFIACFLMGVGANLPFALAPGMGLNAYFTYDVVGFRGTGRIKWKIAMAAIFLEGIVFVVLTLTGLRIKFAKAIPSCIKYAMTGGIGFFLAHLGLQTAEGIGLVVTDVATGVTLGGCAPDKRSYAAYIGPDGLPGPTADSYTCDVLGGKMESATTWLGISMVFLIAILLKRGISYAVIVGVTFATALSWFKNTNVSYFEDYVYPLAGSMQNSTVLGGNYRYEYFKQVVRVEPMTLTAGQLDFGFNSEQGGEVFLALFTFLYVDLLDTTGTLFAMATFAGLVDEEGGFEGDTKAFLVDGVATSIGALLGTSPVTTYIESAPGIAAGGRTGLTAVTVSFLFLISIFFAPLLASVPPWATGPALIVVGAMMMRGLVKINWEDYQESIPAFVTIALMPLTYSIAYGIIAGLFTWVVIKLADMALDAIFQKVESKDEPQSYYVGQPGMLQPVADGQMPVMMSMPVADPSQPFSVAPMMYPATYSGQPMFVQQQPVV